MNKARLAIFSLVPTLVLFGIIELFAWNTMAYSWGYISESTDPRFREFHYWQGFLWGRRSKIRMNLDDVAEADPADLAKPTACRTLVVLGDSMTFGHGVNDGRSFPDLVEARSMTDDARQRGRPCVRVINLAFPGQSLVKQAKRYAAYAPIVKPDALLISQFENDIHDLVGKTEAEMFAEPNTIRVGRWFYDIWLYESGRYWGLCELDKLIQFAGTHDGFVDAKKRYTARFGELVAEARAGGVEVASIFLPSFAEVMSRCSDEQTYYAEMAASNGIPHMSLMATLKPGHKPCPYIIFEGHLNEEGHRMIAGALDDWFFGTSPPPLPSLTKPR